MPGFGQGTAKTQYSGSPKYVPVGAPAVMNRQGKATTKLRYMGFTRKFNVCLLKVDQVTEAQHATMQAKSVSLDWLTQKSDFDKPLKNGGHWVQNSKEHSGKRYKCTRWSRDQNM